MYVQPFTMEVDWPEIAHLMEGIYYVLYLQILRFYLVWQSWRWDVIVSMNISHVAYMYNNLC